MLSTMWVLVGFASPGNPMITKEQAVAIATEFAKEDVFERFPEAYPVQVVQLPDGKWVVRLESMSPEESRTREGGYYMYVTIDGQSGAVISSDAGGGS